MSIKDKICPKCKIEINKENKSMIFVTDNELCLDCALKFSKFFHKKYFVVAMNEFILGNK